MKKTTLSIFLVSLFVGYVFVLGVNAASGVFFNGGGEINLGNSSSLNIHSGNATGITIEMWIRLGNTSAFRNIFQLGDYRISVWNLELRFYDYYLRDQFIEATRFIRMEPGNWHHVCYQIDDHALRVFLNGAQLYSDYDGIESVIKGMPLAGSSPGVSAIIGLNSFTGTIDELRISNIARYDGSFMPSPGPFTVDVNTMGLWHFDEGAGTTTADATGNNSPATLSGASWTEDFTTNPFFYPFTRHPKLDPSPFGTSIHHWNTRDTGYDDGIDDGMINAKLLRIAKDMGCPWLKDYGQSDNHSYYWPENCGYSYMDSYEYTLNTLGLSPLYTGMGHSSPDHLRGKAPDDWPKFFNLQKEVALRYKNTIKMYKAGHEIDNIDGGCRWIDTCKNYVRYLKYMYDAVNSADPDLICCLGDLCRPTMDSNVWNNGEYYYDDGMLWYVDEDGFDKMLYEITTNGNDPRYDTTSLGGFPASTNPLDYMEGYIGMTCYTGPGAANWINTNVDTCYSTLMKYGIERHIDLQIQENNNTSASSASDGDAENIIEVDRHLLRKGNASHIFFFHFDGICLNGTSQEVGGYLMVDWDYNRDGVFDEEIHRYPVVYAHKKMTHMVYPRFEEFYDDEFKETGGTKFYNTGWIISNFSNWSVSNSTWNVGTTIFSGTTGNNPNMIFRDLVMPTWTWRKWNRPDWDRYAMNRYFTVRMKANTNSQATLYWDNVSRLHNESDFSDTTNSASFSVTGDGQYHVYTVDLSQNPNWEGIVAAVRFDPTEASGDNIEIDFLGFTDVGEGTEVSVSVTAYPTTLLADGSSTSNITATVVDDMGIPVSNSTAEITFNIAGGGGTLIGTNPVNASGGRASIAYQAGTQEGTATVTATSPGLTQGLVNITLIKNDPPNKPTNLLCNGQSNPTDVADYTPDLSWTFSDPDSGDNQSAYRILVADSLGNINSDIGNVWDTDKVNSTSESTTYSGPGLQSSKEYHWKVKTWDGFGMEGSYSDAATFILSALIGDGLSAIYYDNMDFTGTTVERIDPEINFNWGSGSPDPALGVDTFSTRWTGQVMADYSETYTFYVNVDDGARLWVDNQLIVESWQDQSATEYSGTISLQAGVLYDIKLEYYESGGDATIELRWSSPSTQKQIIPQSNLYSSGGTQPPTPTITVTSPNGVEIWTVGGQKTITWTSQGTVGNVNIELSTDGGSTWTALASGTTNDGNHQITVPNMPSTTCKIYVGEPDGSPSDMSDNNFTIAAGQAFTITIPNGGDNWIEGTERTVVWTSESTAGNVNIDLSTDGGATWTTLVSNTANDELESVIVPDLSSTQCRIKVGEPDGSPSDMSDANFTIVNAPVLKLNKTELDFGNVDIGEIKGLYVQITNEGGSTLFGTITSDKKWIGVTPTSFSGNSVEVAVIVYNDILNESEGEFTGTVSIKTNGGDEDIPVTVRATCVLAKPNPYDPTKGNLTFFGDGIVPKETTIRIYTLNGELVKTLSNVEAPKNIGAQHISGSKDPSTSRITWDSKNEDGKEVANGVYIYTYESPKEKGVGKFTVIRR